MSFVRAKEEVLYVKKDNKFIPIGLNELNLPYDTGDYLVRIRVGKSFVKKQVLPLNVKQAKKEIILEDAIDSISQALVVASELKLRKRELTKREKRAWETFKKVMGEDMFCLQLDSAYDIARQSVQCLQESLEGESRCPDNCLEVFAEKKNKKKNKKEIYARNSKMV